MKFVRGHGEARWMPSRHNFALFRLFAYLRLRGAQHVDDDTILGIERYQSNFETTAVAVWLVLTVSCCFAVTMPWMVAFVAAVLGLQAALVTSGLVVAPFFPGSGVRVTSFVVMTLIAALAAYTATRDSWLRFAGWQFFVVAALNVIAAVIMFLLRDSVARLESSCVH